MILFRSHRSSTLDFHFLSHYSYIKAIMLYKGNHWTHLLATCIPYGYNRTSLQDSARSCKIRGGWGSWWSSPLSYAWSITSTCTT